MNNLKRWLLITAVMGAASLAAGCGTFSEVDRGVPADFAGQKVAASGMTMTDQLRKFSLEVDPNVHIAMGSCDDLTGGYRETASGMPAYSRAATQGGGDIMGTFIKMAGFRMVDRSPYNFGMMLQERKLQAYQDSQQQAGAMATHILPPITEANYILTCSIVTYDPDVTSGGGGGSWDAMGATFSRSAAEVGVVVKLEGADTSDVIDSVYLVTRVEGQSLDVHFDRFIGDVGSTALTLVGSGSASTILSPQSKLHLASGEVGGAFQFSINQIVSDAFISGLTEILDRNKARLYKKGANVNFTYNVPKGD